MKQRFNIRLALEGDPPTLEVDKEQALTPEQKALRDIAQQTEGTGPAQALASATPEPTPEPTSEPTLKPEDDVDADPAEDTAEDTPGSEDEVATDKSEKESKNADVDTAVDVAAGLEEISNIIRKSLDTGGLTRSSASAANVVLNTYYKEVGINPRSVGFPALEAFDSYSARLKNTELALEGIDSAVSRVWEAITASLVGLTERIKNILGKLIFMCRSYAGQIKTLHAALNKTSRSEPTKASYDNSSVIKNLTYRSSFDPVSSLKAISLLLDNASKTINGVAHANLVLIKSSFAAAAFGDDITSLPKMKTDENSVFPGLKRVAHGEGNSNVEHYTHTDLPGGIVISSDLPKDGLTDLAYLSALRSSYIEIHNNGIVKGLQGDVEIPSKDEIGEILDQCQMVVNSATDVWTSFIKILDGPDFRALQNIITHAAATKQAKQKAIDADPNGATSDTSLVDTKKAVVSYIQALDRLFLEPSVQSVSIGNKVLSSGISFADASIRRYV